MRGERTTRGAFVLGLLLLLLVAAGPVRAYAPFPRFFAYDGMRLVQERTTPGVPAITYLRGLDLSGTRTGAGGIGGLLARVDHAAARMDLYHADGAGNVTALVSTNGAVVARYLYDPFGTLLASSGPLASANTMRFSSKPWQDAPGLYDFGFRFYDPNLQRWLNQDPIQEHGGINLYRPNRNNPNFWIDRNGRDTWALGVAGNIGNGLQFGFSDQFTISYNDTDTSILDARLGIATSVNPGTIVGNGLGGAAGVLCSFSPAKKPEEWNGWSMTVGGSGGEAFVGGLDVCNLPSRSAWKVDGFAGAGLIFGLPALPAEGHVGASYTQANSMSIGQILKVIAPFLDITARLL